MRCESCRRGSPTTGRSRAISKRWPAPSATAAWWRLSRPRWVTCGEVGRAEGSPLAAPVSRQRGQLRAARAGDRVGRGDHRWRVDENRAGGRGVLRRRDRLELVAIRPNARGRAGPMTAVGTLDATVEALCGDLSRIRAPRGTELNARSWATEAPLRMLLNNLDSEVAELPEELIVYGGSGRAARTHEALKAIVASLLRLADDETLLVQSGKPVGVFRTHSGAPRVLIANSLLVPRWATWDEFRRLEALGLTMFGQMTAGSWIYIGTQGILQGTYQTFAAAGEKHFSSPDLSGRTILTAGLDVEAATALRSADPEEYVRRARESIAAHVEGLLEYVRAGSYVFDYGNNLRGEAAEGGVEDAFTYPGFVPAYIRPLFCEGIGPFRWAALSGEADDIAAIDAALRELFPEDRALQRWLSLAPGRVAFQGLPARICWLGYGARATAGLAINELVRSGQVKAPVVIGRDHLDSGSVASPYRDTEAVRAGSDAIADWPILNALLNVAAGAARVSVHHGGGVGIGNSIHADMVVVADGTDDAAERLE